MTSLLKHAPSYFRGSHDALPLEPTNSIQIIYVVQFSQGIHIWMVDGTIWCSFSEATPWF